MARAWNIEGMILLGAQREDYFMLRDELKIPVVSIDTCYLPGDKNFVNVGDFDVACSVNAPSSGTSIDTAKAAAALAVKVQGKLLDDGRLQLRFDSNGPGQTNAASYSLTLYLDADADIDVQTEEGATEVTTTGTTRTETKTVKTLRTVTVTWTASELVKTAGGSA